MIEDRGIVQDFPDELQTILDLLTDSLALFICEAECSTHTLRLSETIRFDIDR